MAADVFTQRLEMSVRRLRPSLDCVQNLPTPENVANLVLLKAFDYLYHLFWSGVAVILDARKICWVSEVEVEVSVWVSSLVEIIMRLRVLLDPRVNIVCV